MKILHASLYKVDELTENCMGFNVFFKKFHCKFTENSINSLRIDRISVFQKVNY